MKVPFLRRPRASGPVRKREQGFTLMEMMFALSTLALALVTLIAIQSASVNQTYESRQRLQAMLLARTFLAAIEGTQFSLTDVNETGTPEEVFKNIAPLDQGFAPLLEGTEKFSVLMIVADQDIPSLGERLMSKIILIFAWGDSTSERLLVEYFIPRT